MKNGAPFFNPVPIGQCLSKLPIERRAKNDVLSMFRRPFRPHFVVVDISFHRRR
jgi:hypothetical protein